MKFNEKNSDKLLKNKKGGKDMETNQENFENLLKNNKELTQEEIDRIIRKRMIELQDAYYELEAETIEWKTKYITNLHRQQHNSYYDDYFGNGYNENYYTDDDTYNNYY